MSEPTPTREHESWQPPGLAELWRETLGDPRICIAVLDGPVDRMHPSLSQAKLTDLARTPARRGLASRHGTHVASVIFAQHDGPLRGMAPRCSGALVPIFSDDYEVRPSCSQEELGGAITAAVRAGAQIINISAGDLAPHSSTAPALEAAVRDCVRAGVLIISAAGNQGRGHLQVPGVLPAVLAVGAMSDRGEPLESNNWSMACDDCGVLAPGAAIPGAVPGGGTSAECGTSSAAAIVSGVAALLLSVQLKYGHEPNSYAVRQVILDSARRHGDDSGRVLAGRLDVGAALALLKARLAANGSPAPSDDFRVAPRTLQDRYAGVSVHKFGSVDIAIPGRGSYNVQDLHYRVASGQLGMRLVPVSDDESGCGDSAIDRLLREDGGLGPEEPVFALLSYVRPEEHALGLFELAGSQKLQMGHQHLGAYLGRGRTSHRLPRTGDWRGSGPLDMNWNVDRYPANVQTLSLHGVAQSTLNRNAHIVNAILASTGHAPLDPQSLECRTIDINTTLQFYRDSIRRAEYLDELSWRTNCAVHTAIVVNVMLNVPHNERAFREIFGAGDSLWLEFKRRHEEIHGVEFSAEDETHFEPLWRLSGLDAPDIAPLKLSEYNSLQAARAEGWLAQYSGRRPLAPGRGLAWPPETVLDLLSRFLETYVSLGDAGGVGAAAVLISLRCRARVKLGIDEETYGSLVQPIAARLVLLGAAADGMPDRIGLERARLELHRLMSSAECERAAGKVPVQFIDECVACAARQLAEFVCPEELWDFEPQRRALQGFAESGIATAGFFVTPSIIHQLVRGLHQCSPFIEARTVCTAMDRSELVCKPQEVSIVNDIKVALGATSGSAATVSRGTQAIEPASCDCNLTDAASLAYALGQVGYDFVNESRLNSVKQKMGRDKRPDLPEDLLEHLDANPHDSAAIQWMLILDGAPLYVIEPRGAFARETHELLRQFLREQMLEGVERVAIPGAIAGASLLRSGASVPVLVPELRGMASWTTEALVSALGEIEGKSPAIEKRSGDGQGVQRFLDRVYYELRNSGRLPQERAVNFAATNAFDVDRIFEETLRDEMDLDDIQVGRSPIARPGADCWDVHLTFFYPGRQVQTVRKVYRLTVDVADVVPSTIGTTRSWFVR